MWNEIVNQNDLDAFLNVVVSHFHDSCIKEMKYLSGAYVDESLDMYPVNDRRTLSMIIEQQVKQHSVLELEFSGLRFLKLFPVDEQHTSEILEATLLYQDGLFYWYDCGLLARESLTEYEGTVICASRLRWRSLDGCLGQTELYTLPEGC